MRYWLLLAMAYCCCVTARAYRDRGYLYLSPVPQAEYVSPSTRFVILRFDGFSPDELTNLATFVTVSGSSTGVHSGETRIASDRRTVIFEMPWGFSRGEVVTVNLDPVGPAAAQPYEYRFCISGPMPDASPAYVSSPPAAPADMQALSVATPPPPATGARIMPNGVSVPGDFPAIDILVNDDPAPGYVFIDYSGSGTDYGMILDSSGSPVWYRRGEHRDFKVQPNGMITYLSRPDFTGYDEDFHPVATFRAVNGYSTDEHELQVVPDGGYLLIGVRSETVDMRRFVSGGRSNATVHESVLQEFTAEGDLVFQWRAWDHHDIRLMEYWSYDDKPTSGSIRFPHMNAIDVDTDGHLLLSSKRVSEVTKINRDSGEVIWRLGSGHPTDPAQDPYVHERLTILEDPLDRFNVQHDIRVVGENRYTVFDNHHLDGLPNSRAVEYEVDPVGRTATMVWECRGGYDSYHMGNVQRLTNGNTLINWVIQDAPKATEVRPDGTKAFEMNWSDRTSKSYRVFKFPWEGTVTQPFLFVEPPQADHVTLGFNRFGDPNVDHYRIYAGTSSPPNTLLATSTDTLMHIYGGLTNGTNYFQVTAVDDQGVESPPSNIETATVNFGLAPGQNMVRNGDFSTGEEPWTLYVAPNVSASWSATGAEASIAITGPGVYPADIQLRQTGMQLAAGREYLLECVVRSQQPRSITVAVGPDSPGGGDYFSRSLQITPNSTALEYRFVMEQASDFTARIEFHLGGSASDVYLDSVSLREVLPSKTSPVVLVVSDCLPPGVNPDQGNHHDDELVLWLQRRGFDVDTTCMNGACASRNGPFGSPAVLEALAGADVVLVSRRTTSGDYSGDAYRWNSLETPLVLCSGYLTQSGRWSWTSCGSTDAFPASSSMMAIPQGMEDHPFLKGLAGSVPLFDWSQSPNPGSCPKGVYVPSCNPPGAMIIGRFGDWNQAPMLFEIPTGTALPNGNTAGDRRVFFAHWGYDVDLGPPLYREANWDDFVRNEYRKIILNILRDLTAWRPGDFNYDGCTDLADLSMILDVWLMSPLDAPADLDLDGAVDFADFALLAENWTRICP